MMVREMSADALPYTLLLLLAEFTTGGLWVLWGADLRGGVVRSYVKFGAILTLVSAAITFWVAAKISVPEEVNGYRLDADSMPAARAALGAFFALCFPYALLALRENRRPGLLAGALASAAGLTSIALLVKVFALPTWGYLGTLLSLVVGALAVGTVSMGMILGHWYLLTPRLSERPLREVTLFLLGALAAQALLLVPALTLPHDPPPAGEPILQSRFFWMRVSGGLAFPMLLTFMAYESSGLRAMQSATGLLYIVLALILSGEVLAKGLLFTTVVPT